MLSPSDFYTPGTPIDVFIVYPAQLEHSAQHGQRRKYGMPKPI